jgi:hypothetical protein
MPPSGHPIPVFSASILRVMPPRSPQAGRRSSSSPLEPPARARSASRNDADAGVSDMTRTLVAYALAAALLASSAHAQSLLPSQDSRNFFGAKICRDRVNSFCCQNSRY